MSRLLTTKRLVRPIEKSLNIGIYDSLILAENATSITFTNKYLIFSGKQRQRDIVKESLCLRRITKILKHNWPV